HTRFKCDWSSTCALPIYIHVAQSDHTIERGLHSAVILYFVQPRQVSLGRSDVAASGADSFRERLSIRNLRGILRLIKIVLLTRRSEERRVGKEGRCGAQV